jgi:hemerythrin
MGKKFPKLLSNKKLIFRRAVEQLNIKNVISKWANNMSRHFSKEDRQMARDSLISFLN